MRRLPVLRFVAVGAGALGGLMLFKKPQSALINGFALVNRFIPWHRLPASIGIFNLLAYRDVLRAKNLYDTTSIPSTGGAQPGKREPDVLYSRLPEGSYNDLNVPTMGMAGTRFGRNVPLEHAFPDPEPALLTPSPRTVANTLLAREVFKPATTLNLLAAAWIQFMTHDWFNHGTPQPRNEFQIPLARA